MRAHAVILTILAELIWLHYSGQKKSKIRNRKGGSVANYYICSLSKPALHFALLPIYEYNYTFMSTAEPRSPWDSALSVLLLSLDLTSNAKVASSLRSVF